MSHGFQPPVAFVLGTFWLTLFLCAAYLRRLLGLVRDMGTVVKKR